MQLTPLRRYSEPILELKKQLTLARLTGLSGKGLRIQQGLSNASNVIALLALGFRCTDTKSWEVWKGQTHQLQPASKKNAYRKYSFENYFFFLFIRKKYKIKISVFRDIIERFKKKRKRSCKERKKRRQKGYSQREIKRLWKFILVLFKKL